MTEAHATGITRFSLPAFLGAPVFSTTFHTVRVQSQTTPLSPRCRALLVSRRLHVQTPPRESLAQTSRHPKMSDAPIEERRRKATQLKTRIKSLTSPVPYLSHSRFKELRETCAPMLIIDTREPEEVSVSTIPSAVPMSAVDERIRNLKRAHGDDFNVVCYCTVGFRSGLYAKGLSPTTKNVYNYSLMEHLWGDGALVSGREEGQTRVHLYSRHYQSYFPDKYPVEAFGRMTALFRGLGHLPGLLSVVTSKNLQLEEETIGS